MSAALNGFAVLALLLGELDDRMQFFAASAISTAMSICALRGRQADIPIEAIAPGCCRGAGIVRLSYSPTATGRRTGSPGTGHASAVRAHRKRIRRGSFHCLGDLQATINRYLTSTTPTQLHPDRFGSGNPHELSECFIRVSALPQDVPSARQHLAHRVDKVLNAIVIVSKVGDEISALG